MKELSHLTATVSAELARVAALWDLRPEAFVARTDKGVVLKVRAEGALAALKLLSAEGRAHEALAPVAMAAFDGAGMIRALRAEEGAQLMDWCAGPVLQDAPGGTGDDVALPALLEVLRAMRAAGPPRPEGVPPLERRLRSLLEFDGAGAAPDVAALLFSAQAMARALLESSGAPALLHGDLHHENIMHCPRRGWLAIDPQPFWGDPAYDLANFFSNPIHAPEIARDPARPPRLAAAMERALGLPAERILRWAHVHAALSAVWGLAGIGDFEHRFAVAQNIARWL